MILHIFYFLFLKSKTKGYWSISKRAAFTLLMSLFLFLCAGNNTYAQNGKFGFGTNSPDNSAEVEIKSTVRGFLAPRMTQAQRDAIVFPATSLLIFQTDNTPGFYYNYSTIPASPIWLRLSDALSGPYLLISGGIMTGSIDMNNTNLLLNIGNANTDFTATGGLHLADTLKIFSNGGRVKGDILDTGNITISNNGGTVNELRMNSKNGNYTGFKAPDSITASFVYKLPAADGTSGQVLSTNGSAVLSWITLSSLPSGTSGQTLRNNGTSWVADTNITNTGTRVGINTKSPRDTFDVNGTARIGVNGTTITEVIKATVTIDVPAMNNNNSDSNIQDVNVTVTGARTGSTVTVSPSSDLPSGVVIAYAYVTGNDAVRIRFINTSVNAGNKDPISMSYYITVIR